MVSAPQIRPRFMAWHEIANIAWNSALLTLGSSLSCCKVVLFPIYGAITLQWVEVSPVAFTELDCS